MIKTIDVPQSPHRRLGLTHTGPLFLLGLSVFSVPAQAGDGDALPHDPSIAAGGASFVRSGHTLTVNQATDRVVIDWRSFDIGANAQTNFNQPNSRSIAVNRIGAGTDPTRINGGLSANGQVWILNPNGVLFGGSARVNAAGIVASTANIDTSRFMAGDNRLLLTGPDSGTVINDGHISVGESGLAAFVAPSVRNNGVITARAGKVTLAAGTTFTLDLAGDHLIEIGLGADKAVVDQSGKIVNPGGLVNLSARAASEVVDGAINMSGVVRTASARRAGGAIILDADTVILSGTADASGTSGGSIAIAAKTITVSDGAIVRADGRGDGNGGTIIAVAAGRASYAGQYTARGGAAGGDGGKIETSGEEVITAPTIRVDASAPGGKAGEWLIDPLNVTIAAGSGGGLTGATVTAGAIQTALAGGTSVAITTAQGGTDAGDLTLAGTINAAAAGNAGLTLTGRRLQATGNSVINIAGGALTLNVNAVNAGSMSPTGVWISDALGMIGTVSGGSTINLGAGTYTLSTQLNVTKRVSLMGAGIGDTILTSNSTSYGINVTADNVRLSGFTFNAPAAVGSATYGIKVTPDSNVRSDRLLNFAIDHVRINGGYRTGLDLHGAVGATIDTVSVANVVHGNGIALTDSANVTITNTTTSNNAWGGLALYQTNKFYDQRIDNISVNASNSFNEAIPVYAEDQSASLDIGTLALAGFGFVVKAPNLANDVYTWFQKTARAAIDFATNAAMSNNNLNLSTATVQGYGGNGVQGNNAFTVGIGSNGTAMSIGAALNAASAGAVLDIASGTYAESLTQNIRATMNFGTVILGGSYTLNSGAANSVLSGSLSAAAVNWNALVDLGGALSLDTRTTNGAITIAAINGGQTLTLNAGTGAISLGDLGTTARLGAVSALSRTMLTGGAYNAASLNFAGDVILTAAQTTLDTKAAGGNITVAGTLRGSFDGAQSVILLAGSGTGAAAQNGDLVLQNVGASGLALGNMTVVGGNFSAQTVHLAGNFNSTLTGNQVFSSNTLNAGGLVQSAVGGNASGPINAGGAVGLSVSGQLSGTIGGSNIDLTAGTIQGATVNATQGVIINANTVAGSTLNAQTVSAPAANFSTNVNAASVTLDAGTITGSTIIGSSGIAIKAKSVQGSSLAAPTVTATADSFNTIVAASSSARISGIDVAGTFTGGSFSVSGTNSVNANMTTNSASVRGGTIAGTYTGNAVSLTGSTSVNATVTSKTLSVQSPSGNLQGTWASVDTGSSGTLLLNKQANIGGDVGPSQLVVENFALPKRSAVTARGDILLPQNLALGLLSPAGASPPAFVVVQSVQQLGTLLSQNYSAIVIDLGGSARKDRSTD